MTTDQFDAHSAATLPATTAAVEARPGAWLPETDRKIPERPAPGDRDYVATSPDTALVGARTWPIRLWRGRGLVGGLLAVGIAWLGQSALVGQNDYVASTRDYLIAIAILILSLYHPSWLGLFKRGKGGSQPSAAVEESLSAQQAPISVQEQGSATSPAALPSPSLGASNALPLTDASSLPVRPLRAKSAIVIASSTSVDDTSSAEGNGRSLQIDGSTLKPALARSEAPLNSARSKTSVWNLYAARRERLGWRITAPGLVVSLALAAASFIVLNGDSGSPLGGWLWAASLIVIALTFIGASGWPKGEGLLPTPWSDWFGPGVPRIPWQVEALLVVLLMCAATFLRVWNLELHPGIFGDEGERGMDARAILEGRPDNLFSYGWWGVPNMYFYLLTISFRIFGDNLTGDRMLSSVSGIVAVWYVYKIGRLLWGPRAGLIAGAMMAVSPLALQFSRLAGESTPTGALWAVGAYYLLLALRYRRWSDWVLSGFFWSFNLYFYASGKMVIPLAAAVAIYALIRWRLEFFKRYFLGFALMGLVFIVTFMPYGITSAKDNWQGFMGRANETSIFSPQNQAATFARYGLQYDPTWASKSTFENFRTNPLAWGGLLYQQSREVLDGVYRRGDQVPFYNVQGIVALAPFWAVLALLGLAYAAWKFWDPRYAIAMLWFVIGMGATILTIDAPNYQRYTNAWPAMMLFPAALVDRVFAAGWPLSLSLARKWSALPLVALVIFLGVDSYREYFIFYPTTCPYCTSTVQARYAQALGQDYKAYQMGVGGYDNYFSYGSTRFVAKDVEGVDMVAAADDLPVTDNNGKGLAFIIYSNNSDYLPLLRLFYPMGQQEEIKGVDGSVQFTSIKVTKEQLASTRTLHATYKPTSGAAVERDETGIGTSADRPLPQDLTFPVNAEWKGGLVAPQYGMYTFALAAGTGQATLQLDGRAILQQEAGSGPSTAPLTAQVVLAKGIHDIDLTGTLTNAKSGLSVQWSSAGGALSMIDMRFLFNGPTGGLSGELGPLLGSAPAMLAAQDPFGSKPLTQRRSDPFIGFREASVIFNNQAYLARWRGKLKVPTDGDYSFSFGAGAAGTVVVDGKSVYGTGPGGAAAGGAVHLTAGLHDIEARYASQGGSARIELLWTVPGGQPAIIPPTNLVPLQRSWTPQELPNTPAANLPPPSAPEAASVQPELVFGGGDLSSPRGIAVDKAGNIFVGDRGNHRVVAFAADGKVSNSWGQAAPQAQNGQNPSAFKAGDFADILDVGASQDGVVYAFDSTGRLQAFSAKGDFIGSYAPDELSLYAPNGIGLGPTTSTTSGSNVYIAVTGQSRVVMLPPMSSTQNSQPKLAQSIQSITADGESSSQLDQPVDVAIDPSGDGAIYVADLKDRVVKLTPPQEPGKAWTIGGQWPVLVGRTDGGSRLAVSPDGTKVYMTDPDRHRVDVLELTTGQVSYFGGEGAGPGQFEVPSGIAVDQGGQVFVVDSVNHNVQSFKLSALK